MHEYPLINELKKKKKKTTYQDSGNIQYFSLWILRSDSSHLSWCTYLGILEIISCEIDKEHIIPPQVIQTMKSLKLTDKIRVSMKGKGLDQMDTFGKSGQLFFSVYLPTDFSLTPVCFSFIYVILDPFVVIYKLNKNPDQPPLEIYRTEVVDNNLNPEWKTFSLNGNQSIRTWIGLSPIYYHAAILPLFWSHIVSDICEGEELKNVQDIPILMEVFDYDTVGSNDLIGIFKVNL